MTIRIFIMACLIQLSFSTQASETLPSSIFKEIQAATNMQPGDVVYLDFWASWCGPCRKSFPWMNEMHQSYEKRGLKVLAVNLDKDRSSAKVFLDKVPTSFPILYDPKGRLAKVFKLKGMPSSYVIDYRGRIKATHVGFFDNKKAKYERQLVSMLRR